MCVNQGRPARRLVGSSFLCYGTADGLAFADVNGDGNIERVSLDISSFY